MDPIAETQEERKPNRLLIKHIFRKVFLEDWAMKLVALAITLALWLGVTGLSEIGSYPYTVPLYVRVAENIEIMSDPKPQIEIRVSGDKRRLGQIRESDLRISIDLTHLPPGDHVVNLSPASVTAYDLPTGVKLEDIQPNKINVRLENLETKELPIRIRTRGDIADGFEIAGDPTANPAVVRVRGPQSVLEKLTEVTTEIIDLTDRRTEFTERQVPLSAGVSQRVTLLESAADVRVPIRETRIERVLLLPVEGLFDRKATVVLFGPRSVVNALKPEQLSVTANKNEAGEEGSQVRLPAEFQNIIEIRQVRLRP